MKPVSFYQYDKILEASLQHIMGARHIPLVSFRGETLIASWQLPEGEVVI